MLELVMMKGLPGSGKSTIAKEKYVSKGFKRINKDDLRAMLDDSKWTPGNEKFIIAQRNAIVGDALMSGRSVVVDDTNFEPKHEEKLRQMAQDLGAKFTIDYVETPFEVCVERDLKRLHSVGETVIRRMYNKYVRVIETPKPAKDTAVIIDIDGTLAHMVDRSPYDYTKVSEDTPDTSIIPIIQALDIANGALGGTLQFIIVSGRDHTCREDTIAWLDRYGVPYDQLFMRDANVVDEKGNKVADTIIKNEIYEREINGKYKVVAVFDDRDQVVKMWRQKGLKVLQVAEGDF